MVNRYVESFGRVEDFPETQQKVMSPPHRLPSYGKFCEGSFYSIEGLHAKCKSSLACFCPYWQMRNCLEIA